MIYHAEEDPVVANQAYPFKTYTDELGQKVKTEGKWSKAVEKTTKK